MVKTGGKHKKGSPPAPPLAVETLYTYRALDCEAAGQCFLAKHDVDARIPARWAVGLDDSDKGLAGRAGKHMSDFIKWKREIHGRLYDVLLAPVAEGQSFIIVYGIVDGCTALKEHGYEPTLIVQAAKGAWEAVWMIPELDEAILEKVAKEVAAAIGGEPDDKFFLPGFENPAADYMVKIVKASTEPCHAMTEAIKIISEGGTTILKKEAKPEAARRATQQKPQKRESSIAKQLGIGLDDIDPIPAAEPEAKPERSARTTPGELPPADRPPMGVDPGEWKKAWRMVDLSRNTGGETPEHARHSADEIVRAAIAKGHDGVMQLLWKEELVKQGRAANLDEAGKQLKKNSTT
jgi:hypothetical protein